MIIRSAIYNDIPSIAKIQVDTWRTTYQGIVPDEYLMNLSYDRTEDKWFEILSTGIEDSNFTYTAEEESGQIIGFANGGVERTNDPVYEGELYSIYILQNYQRQGIGKNLMSAITENLSRSGIYSMLAWVLANNPAYQFYTALGGIPVYEEEIAIAGKLLDQIAYGWKDTKSLCVPKLCK